MGQEEQGEDLDRFHGSLSGSRGGDLTSVDEDAVGIMDRDATSRSSLHSDPVSQRSSSSRRRQRGGTLDAMLGSAPPRPNDTEQNSISSLQAHPDESKVGELVNHFEVTVPVTQLVDRGRRGNNNSSLRQNRDAAEGDFVLTEAVLRRFEEERDAEEQRRRNQYAVAKQDVSNHRSFIYEDDDDDAIASLTAPGREANQTKEAVRDSERVAQEAERNAREMEETMAWWRERGLHSANRKKDDDDSSEDKDDDWQQQPNKTTRPSSWSVVKDDDEDSSRLRPGRLNRTELEKNLVGSYKPSPTAARLPSTSHVVASRLHGQEQSARQARWSSSSSSPSPSPPSRSSPLASNKDSPSPPTTATAARHLSPSSPLRLAAARDIGASTSMSSLSLAAIRHSSSRTLVERHQDAPHQEQKKHDYTENEEDRKLSPKKHQEGNGGHDHDEEKQNDVAISGFYDDRNVNDQQPPSNSSVERTIPLVSRPNENEVAAAKEPEEPNADSAPPSFLEEDPSEQRGNNTMAGVGADSSTNQYTVRANGGEKSPQVSLKDDLELPADDVLQEDQQDQKISRDEPVTQHHHSSVPDENDGNGRILSTNMFHFPPGRSYSVALAQLLHQDGKAYDNDDGGSNDDESKFLSVSGSHPSRRRSDSPTSVEETSLRPSLRRRGDVQETAHVPHKPHQEEQKKEYPRASAHKDDVSLSPSVVQTVEGPETDKSEGHNEREEPPLHDDVDVEDGRNKVIVPTQEQTPSTRSLAPEPASPEESVVVMDEGSTPKLVDSGSGSSPEQYKTDLSSIAASSPLDLPKEQERQEDGCVSIGGISFVVALSLAVSAFRLAISASRSMFVA